LDEAKYSPIPGYKVSRMMYLLSIILTHKQDKHPGAWAVLHMVYLRAVVPNAHQYMKYLKEEEVIEVINHFMGRNSRLYRISKAFEGPSEFRMITDMNLIRRIQKANVEIKKHSSRKYPELNRMTEQVRIDLVAAHKAIEDKYKETEDKMQAEARRTYSLAEVEKIDRGEIFYSVNDTNGRYDSNFTRLPAELVQHLSIDYKPLQEVDIANSQILFSVCLFNPSPEVTKVMREFLGNKFTIYIKGLQMEEYEDVRRYALLALSGLFYEEMMKLFNLQSRKQVKELVFTVLFSRNSAIRYSKEVRMFKGEFPSVYEMFSTIKAKQHNRLAILLQRIESHVVLNHVVPAILENLPEVKFITKHDSILPASLFVAGDTEKVSELLKNTVYNVTGLRPIIKIKSTAL
jgi:hypothetical protein